MVNLSFYSSTGRVTSSSARPVSPLLLHSYCRLRELVDINIGVVNTWCVFIGGMAPLTNKL